MLKATIPGEGTLDFNGTLACDGKLIPGVEERLNLLAEKLDVHIITADTFGLCKTSCRGINGCISILSSEIGAPEKEKYVEALGWTCRLPV